MGILDFIELVSGLVALIVVFWKVGFSDGKLKTTMANVSTKVDSFEKELQKINQRVERNSTNIERISVKTDLFWKTVESKMVSFVHSPHTPNTDRLLEKLRDGNITLEESIELREVLLKEEKEVTYATDRRFAIVFLLGRLEQVIWEKNTELEKIGELENG